MINSLSKENSEIFAVTKDSVTIPVGGRAIVKTSSSVMLQCFSHGIPMPSVKWYRDGSPINFEKRYATFFNGLLEIKSVSAIDQGSFQCTAKNKFGVQKAAVQLIVVGR